MKATERVLLSEDTMSSRSVVGMLRENWRRPWQLVERSSESARLVRSVSGKRESGCCGRRKNVLPRRRRRRPRERQRRRLSLQN
jgi:hypothetical protein